MDAHKTTIGDIFQSGRLLEIPYYQRAYVWSETEWKRFADDMEMVSKKGASPYFIGSIILKQRKTRSDEKCGDVRVVIDGQQRLTTTELLKNYFFDENNESAYRKCWEPIFEKDEECKQYWDREIVSGSTRWQFQGSPGSRRV